MHFHHAIDHQPTEVVHNPVDYFGTFQKFNPDGQMLAFDAPRTGGVDLMVRAETRVFPGHRGASDSTIVKKSENFAVQEIAR